MPKENFYPATAVEGDDSEPTFLLDWGRDEHVRINGVPFDRSAINRLIHCLRAARDKIYGRDE